MSLANLQKTFGKILLQDEGYQVLDNKQNWEIYLKNTTDAAIQNLPLEKLQIYRSLLKYSVDDTLASLYPFTKKILHNHWPQIVEQYRRAYPNESFQLYRAVKNFPVFLQKNTKYQDQIPYIVDLAWYEWLEVEVMHLPDFFLPENFVNSLPKKVEQYLAWSPFVNEASILQKFNYTVPKIIDKLKTKETESIDHFQWAQNTTSIFIYRDPSSYKVRFLEVNPLTTKLLYLTSGEDPMSYAEILEKLKETTPELNNIPYDVVVLEANKILTGFFNSGILLGSTILMSFE